ncbi:hypothetical protein [Candidatus Uabimicrobium sp. HlEnr_7]|uniref:hypothetical protein n=1 Tax=Candidatus Uabimicrobium helgolandensis TaxID=3095367 RepID=UPI00355776EF
MFKYFILSTLFFSLCFVLCDDEDHIEEFSEEIRELIEHIEDTDDVDEHWHHEIREKAKHLQHELQEMLHEAFREKLQDVVENLGDRLEEENEEEEKDEIREKIEKIRSFINQNRHKELKEFINKYIPEMNEVLNRLKREDHEEYAETIEGLHDDMRELSELKEENIEMFHLAVKHQRYTIKSELLAAKYRENQNNETKKQLLEVLNVIFDARIEMNKREMQALAEELKEVKERLHKKVMNKKQIIIHRFDDLVGKTEFDW